MLIEEWEVQNACAEKEWQVQKTKAVGAAEAGEAGGWVDEAVRRAQE